MLKFNHRDKLKLSCDTVFGNYAYVFVFAMLIALIATAITFVLAEDTGIVRGLLFVDYRDVGMDHYNSIMATAGRAPYTTKNISYPPLAAMLYYLFYLLADKVTTRGIIAAGGITNYPLRDNSHAVLAYTLYTVLCVLFITMLIQKNLRVSEGKKTAAVIGSFLSVGFLSVIDRGNNILLVTLFVLYYVCYYNSDNKFLSETALIALALATGLKLYPMVFGVLLIRRHKIWQGFRALFYIFLALFLPFFFFEGFEAIGVWLSVLFPSGGATRAQLRALNFSSAIYNLEVAFGINVSDGLVTLLSAVFVLSGLLVSITFKKDYKAMLFCVFAIVGFAGLTFRYFLFLSIIPLLYLFTKCDSVRDRIWAVLLVLINLPLSTKTPQFLVGTDVFLPDLISNVLLFAVLVYLLVDGAIDLVAYVKDGRYRYLVKTEKQMKELPHVPTWVE